MDKTKEVNDQTENKLPPTADPSQPEPADDTVTAEELAAAQLDAISKPTEKVSEEATVKSEMDRLREEIRALRSQQEEQRIRNEQLAASLRREEKARAKKGATRRSAYFDEAEEDAEEQAHEKGAGTGASAGGNDKDDERRRFDRMFLERQIADLMQEKVAEIKAIGKLDPSFIGAVSLAFESNPAKAFELLKSKVSAYEAARSKKSVQVKESIRPRNHHSEEPNGRRVTRVDGSTSHADFLIYMEEESARLEREFRGGR